MDKRKDQYKPGQESADNMRSKRRHEQTELRKEKRAEVLVGKRIRIDQNDNEEKGITLEQVVATAIQLRGKGDGKRELLRVLRRAFSQGTALIDAFLSVDNSMTTLVTLLTGQDPEVQLEAAWCLTNLAAGTDGHATTVLKHAGSYLVTYLSSANPTLQDQCAWAVGNLAGSGVACRDTLRAHGAVVPLIHLLQSPVESVIQSSAFALSNLARDKSVHSELISGGILPHLAAHLVYLPSSMPLVAEISWVLTYLAASGEHTPEIVSAGLLDNVTVLVGEICDTDLENSQALTPLLRCLGNIVCNAHVDALMAVCQDKRLVSSLSRLLQCQQHMHIRKETLWVLSNITVIPAACQEVITAGCLSSIIQQLSTTIDIKKEAALCLCNIASQSSPCCIELLNAGALEALVPLLKLTDPEMTHMGLSLVNMILSAEPKASSRFESAGGLNALELLEYCENTELRSETNNLLDAYFYNEDN